MQIMQKWKTDRGYDENHKTGTETVDTENTAEIPSQWSTQYTYDPISYLMIQTYYPLSQSTTQNEVQEETHTNTDNEIRPEDVIANLGDYEI